MLNPSTYIHSWGCGDFVQVESFWTEAQRDAFETMFYSVNTRQTDALRHLIESCPRYKKVKHRYLSYPTERLKGAIVTMADHGILDRLTFTGSSFLKETLTSIDYDLPERFDFVQVHTSLNTKQVRGHRDIRDSEWDAIINRLEDRDTVGVLIDSDANTPIPESDRLIDLRGKTTSPQAVEVLKRCTGYLGIDSVFAILAAQLHKPQDLLIRTNNPYLVRHAHVYYPPHDWIDFLTPCIGKARHPAADRPPVPDGVLVEMRCNALVGDRVYGPGERACVDKARAEQMYEARQAVPYHLEDTCQ